MEVSVIMKMLVKAECCIPSVLHCIKMEFFRNYSLFFSSCSTYNGCRFLVCVLFEKSS